MGPVPDCLRRRYTALDGLITELSAVVSNSSNGPGGIHPKISEPGVKLMCQFWNILKENPNCDLKKAVLDKMESNIKHSNFGIENYSCYMAMEDPHSCGARPGSASTPGTPTSCSVPVTGGDGLLSKVLCDLQEAATYDKQCCAKIADLKTHQQRLLDQIQELEARENEGVKMLKKADCMWSCMEDAYKKKIEESIEMQKQHLKEQREFDQSLSKWRQHRKDLDAQVKNLNKCRTEIKQKINQKNNDLKFINTEIGDLKKKIAANESDADTLTKSLRSKQRIASEKQAELAEKLQRLQQDLENENQAKNDKEEDGRKCIRQAREDLQKICTKLLQKRMENEDFKAEREAILSEIELLKITSDQCKDRCKNRKQALAEELAQVKEEVDNFRLKCTKCHKCVDTNDVRRFCTDCPKCMELRDCIYNEDSTCTENAENDCVCMATKRRFLDNVFENMYNVLASQIKTKNGKALAELIFDSLKKSRNGKLSDPTRKAVQEFVLATVKKNLNLTIIGGAVKTRCEMEPSTYTQLMLCLNTVKVDKPPKEDKGTVSKKEPCKRWGEGECHCPNGPVGCICASKAAPTAKDPQPCPPRLKEDYFDIGQAKKCPNRTNMDCGPDCAVPPQKSQVPVKIAKAYQPTPCGGESCTFTKNVRAAQCGPMCTAPPESLTSSKINMDTSVETKNVRAAQCGPMCTAPQESRTSSKINMDTSVETRGAVKKRPQSSDRESKGRGSRRGGESTFTKNMRAAQCALGPCSTKNYDDREPISPVVPYRKLLAKGPRASNDDWKLSRNDGAESRKSYSPIQNDCDCKLTKKRKETGGRSCFTALVSQKSSESDTRDQATEVGTYFGNETRGSTDETDCFCSDLIEVNLMPSKYKDVPRVQAEVLSGAYVDRGTEPNFNITSQERIALEQVVSKLTKPHISKHLKVIIPNVKGEIEHEFTEITVTSSGSMAMALDEKIIEKIGNITKENQVLHGVLRKTVSGHYALEFNKCATSSAVSRQVIVKKTDSGNIIMEIHKDIIETIRPGANTHVISKISSISIGVTKRKGMSKSPDRYYETDHVQAEYKIGVEERKGKYNITRHSFKHSINQHKKCATAGKKPNKETLKNNLVKSNRASGRQETSPSYNTSKKKQNKTQRNPVITNTYNGISIKDEFQKMIEKGYTALDVTIVGENGLKSIIKAEITNTPSRHIAVDVKAIENIGQIANRLKDYPVSLIKTKSKYLLKLGCNNENANAILRRNSTGDMLVVLKDPILKYPENMPEVLESNEAVFVARVRGVQHDDSDEPSLFLRATRSDNFAFVLDKEFEQTYMRTVNGFGVDECPVNISMTDSGVIILDLHSCDIDKNGLLVKSGSGNIKIFTACPINIEKLQMYRSTVQSDVFKLFSKLYREHLKTKSCSDTLLYGKVKMYDQRRQLSDAAAILKKTEFGKYAVVLNNDSKVKFLNNVKKYISNTGSCLLPIKLTKDGDLIICLCHDHDGLYGSVKISASGNIYVSIDENVIKDIDKKTVEMALSGPSSVGSVHFIGSLVDPCNKGVPACCLMQNGCCYDENRYDYEQFSPETSYYEYMTSEQTPNGSYKHCCSNLYETGFVSRNAQGSEDGDFSPIGLLRTTHPKLSFQSKFKERTYLKQTNFSWKELIDQNNPHGQVGFNRETKLYYEMNDKETYRPDLSRLDYLDSMPPQLPSFLRDYQWIK